MITTTSASTWLISAIFRPGPLVISRSADPAPPEDQPTG